MAEELRPTWSMAFRVWWAITWRGFLLSLIPVFLLTIPVSIVFLVLERTTGIPSNITSNMNQMAGMLIGFCVQIYVIKKILNKNFIDFRIVIEKPSTKVEKPMTTEPSQTSVA